MLSRKIRLALLTFVIAAVSGVAVAGKDQGTGPSLPSEKNNWNRIQTAHFTLFSDAPERRARSIAEDMEHFRAVLSIFHSNLVIDPPRPTFVFIFKSDADFLPYKVRKNGQPVSVAGQFAAFDDANYVAIESVWGQDASHIIYHEFLHQFVTANLPNVPVWFNEGIAEYYSTFEGDEKSVKVGRPVPDHVAFLGSHPMMPLKHLFEVDHDSPEYNEADRMSIFYAESWAVVHYLLNGNAELRPKVGPFLDSLNEGKGLEEAFRDSFQIDFGALGMKVRDYIAYGRFPYTTVNFGEALKVDTAMRVERMERDEVLARLGDLLAHLGPDRAADAALHFREALRLNPKSAPAEAGLGYVAAAAQRFPEAIAHFDAARALDSPNFLYPYLAAVGRLGRSPAWPLVYSDAAKTTPEDLVKARDLLRRTIQVRPGFAAAYLSMGETYLQSQDSPDEGIQALQQVRKILPTRMEAAADLVHLYLKAGDRKSAGDLVEKVLVPSGNSGAIRYAKSILEDYDVAHASAKPRVEGSGSETQDRDPQVRAAFEEELLRAQNRDDYNLQVKVINEAVARANAGNYDSAIGILEKLLPAIKNPDLAAATRDLLARLKADSKKYQKPSH